MRIEVGSLTLFSVNTPQYKRTFISNAAAAAAGRQRCLSACPSVLPLLPLLSLPSSIFAPFSVLLLLLLLLCHGGLWPLLKNRYLLLLFLSLLPCRLPAPPLLHHSLSIQCGRVQLRSLLLLQAATRIVKFFPTLYLILCAPHKFHLPFRVVVKGGGGGNKFTHDLFVSDSSSKTKATTFTTVDCWGWSWFKFHATEFDDWTNGRKVSKIKYANNDRRG